MIAVEMEGYHGGEEAVEGTFWGRPQLFANRVFRIYKRVGVDLGYDRKANQDIGPEPAYLAPRANVTTVAPNFGRPRTSEETETTPMPGRKPTSQIAILVAVRNGATTRAAIHKASGLPAAQVRQSINRMVDAERLTKKNNGNGSKGEETFAVGPKALELGFGEGSDPPPPPKKPRVKRGCLEPSGIDKHQPDYKDGYTPQRFSEPTLRRRAASHQEVDATGDVLTVLKAALATTEAKRARLIVAIEALEGS